MYSVADFIESSKKTPFENFFNCFQQQNAWVEDTQMEARAQQMWKGFDPSQRRMFYPDRFKVWMIKKLDIVALPQEPEPVISQTIIEDTDENVTILLNPRTLRFSSSNILAVTAEVHQPPEDENEDTERPQQTAMEIDPVFDLEGVDVEKMSNSSVSPHEMPFFNFLQDYSMAHGTKPQDSLEEAAVRWSQMNADQRDSYMPENFVLKIFNETEMLNMGGMQGVTKKCDKPAVDTIEMEVSKSAKVAAPSRSKAVRKKKPVPKRQAVRKSTHVNNLKARGIVKRAARRRQPSRASRSLPVIANWSQYMSFLRLLRQYYTNRKSGEEVTLHTLGAVIWSRMTLGERNEIRALSPLEKHRNPPIAKSEPLVGPEMIDLTQEEKEDPGNDSQMQLAPFQVFTVASLTLGYWKEKILDLMRIRTN